MKKITIVDRIMGVFSKRFIERRLEDVAEYRVLDIIDDEKQISTINTFQRGQPQFMETSYTNMVEFGYRRNELIYTCIARTAMSAGQVGIKQIDKTTKKEKENTPLIKLMKNPTGNSGLNADWDLYDFLFSIVVYQDLAGWAVYEKERSAAGMVVALHPLRPDWVGQIADTDLFEFTVPGQRPITIPRSELLIIKDFDPLNMFTSWPKVAVASRSGDVDNEVTKYLKLFFQEGGVPAGLLKTNLKLKDAQIEEIRERWQNRYGGSKKWNAAPAVLDSNAEYQRTGSTFDEMQFSSVDSRDEARICMAFFMPPIIVGAQVGLERATYSNYDEARRSWWQDILISRWTDIFSALTQQLAADFGDDLLVPDFSNVLALQDEKDNFIQRVTEAYKAAGVTRNEYRKALNSVGADLEDLGPSGEVFILGLGIVEVPVGGGQRPQAAPTDELSLKVAADAPDFGDRKKTEDEMRRKVSTFLKGQLEAVEGVMGANGAEGS